MRISLRQQLAILLVLSGAIGLAVLAVAVWVVNHDFVLSVSASRLEITASLKAAQVSYNLELIQIGATFVTTRSSIQDALARYNNGSNTSAENWDEAIGNLQTTLGNTGPVSSALILQAEVFAGNSTGPAGTSSVMNVTGAEFESIILPWLNANGTPAYFGEPGSGYPPALYPNLTIFEEAGTPHAVFQGMDLGLNSTLVLGPLNVNSTFSLLSMTIPVVMNSDTSTIVGWTTIVTDAQLIREVVTDDVGLGDTGQTLLIGPANQTNKFPTGVLDNETTENDALVQYVIPLADSARALHPNHVYGTANAPFRAGLFPAVRLAVVEYLMNTVEVGSMMRTHNEADKSVSVGYSSSTTDLVDWIVVVEQARNEVWKPINRLRNIILACLFGVIGFMCIVSFPLAHWAVLPIMRLRAASEQTIAERNGSVGGGSTDSFHSGGKSSQKGGVSSDAEIIARKEGFFASGVSKLRAKRRAYYHVERRPETGGRIPGKVPLRKHRIKDEMYDLVVTFNEMSDELYSQYTGLEERVKQRTEELEASKKSAEAANESKTLFVANVSHELRTPLNGILGLTAVCMEEEDPIQLKKSLRTIYKSGDLLLRTLTDLLTFSTNQVGPQALTLDEKDFAIRDLETQTMAIFGEQAKDNLVDLRVVFEESPGLYGVGKLSDITVFADVHRILQVIINLVSNSLKFTPVGGSVTLTIRCLPDSPIRKGSLLKGRRILSGQPGTTTPVEGTDAGTANFINPRASETHIAAHERTKPQPPGRDLCVQLQVKDTGPGVEEEMCHRIFEPFVQADAGLNRKKTGTGLGLSISSQLVSLMGGTIGLQSTVGEGCLFTVNLPMRQVLGPATPRSSISLPPSRSPSTNKKPNHPDTRTPDSELTLIGTINTNGALPASSPDEPDLPANSPGSLSNRSTPTEQAGKDSPKTPTQDFSKARVLVAEDNKVNQEVILRMLKLEKIFNVTIAADGNEALELVTQRQSGAPAYDIIFMDIQMPNMDGHRATKLIRQAGFEKPIVALTAFADQSNIDECYGSGMDYFLSKPIKRPLLKKVLTEYCSPAAVADDATAGQSREESAAEGTERR